MKRRVIFAGTPDFAACALKALIDAGFDIPLVLTRPDKPKGRGMKMLHTPVKSVALEASIPVAQPSSLRTAEARELIAAQNADVMVVAAYGLILPPEILTLPREGCLNIHASLLPRWRGAAPIQRAIEAGDSETGICIMQMDEGLDTGAVISRDTVNISPEDNAQTLHDKLADCGARSIVTVLQQQGCLKSVPQPETGITYAKKIEKNELLIDWQNDAEAIVRKIRAFAPAPAARIMRGGEVFKILQAAYVQGSGKAGTVLAAPEGRLFIACEKGAVELFRVCPAGSKAMSAADFLRGNPVSVGTPFGDAA